jgi:hypothetical protein
MTFHEKLTRQTLQQIRHLSTVALADSGLEYQTLRDIALLARRVREEVEKRS